MVLRLLHRRTCRLAPQLASLPLRLPQSHGFASVSVQEARRREQVAFESVRDRGGKTASSHTVDTIFSLVFGLGIAAWYFDWFSARKTTPIEELITWLRSKEVAVVVFELDNVMCVRSRGDKGVSPFELEDYLQGVSHEFVEVANGLGRCGFLLAVVAQPRPGSAGAKAADDKPVADRGSWWGFGKAKQTPQLERLDGAELARKLVQCRCPEALSSFKVFLPAQQGTSDQGPKAAAKLTESTGAAQSTDDFIRQIAKHHHVPVHRVVLFTASKDNVRQWDGQTTPDHQSWTGIHVPSPKEGFRFQDIQLPEVLTDQGLLALPRALLGQALSMVGR